MTDRSSSASPIANHVLRLRRRRVFLVLSGFFLGTLAMLNILGISRFLDMSFTIGGVEIPFKLAVGVLPYPLTFLCTDLISELYGRKRANEVVWVGLCLNLFVMFIIWLGSVLPGHEALDPVTGEVARDAADRLPVFFEIKNLAFGAVTASMLAYLAAQFCDVYLFHYFKRLTGGKHLWLRNNASTMVSQFVDSLAVILATHFIAGALPIDENEALWSQLWVFIISGYVFKFVAAAVDTVPLYLLVRWLRGYLEVDPATGEVPP